MTRDDFGSGAATLSRLDEDGMGKGNGPRGVLYTNIDRELFKYLGFSPPGSYFGEASHIISELDRNHLRVHVKNSM